MKSKFTSFYINLPLLLAFLLPGCSTKPVIDLAKEKETLVLLQKQEQDAHLSEQPALLVNMLHDTFVQVKNGNVTFFSKDQMTKRFLTYFENVEFFKWEDTHPPVYTISEDGSMAHILIQKIVILNDITGPEPVRDTTLFAWTELWKKKDGNWKMYQVTTTDVRP